MERKKRLGGFAGIFLVVTGISVLGFDLNLSHPVVQSVSCSNHPIVERGDVILIQNTQFEDIEEGDTVIYRAEAENLPGSTAGRSEVRNLTVVHQVVNKSRDYLQTQGKSNERQLSFEKNVTSSQIWGTPIIKISTPTGNSCV
jgi:signal peptidase I